MSNENYKVFYHNLEKFINKGYDEEWTAGEILSKLAFCFPHEVIAKRFFNKKNNAEKPFKCICGVCIKEAFPFHVLGRQKKKIFVGNKCIERVCKHNKYEVSQEFQNAVFNKCCYKDCKELIVKREVVNSIVINYCKNHRKGYGKYLCSGCNRFATYCEGRPTQSYCQICVDKAAKNANKYKCKYCASQLKTDKYDKCFDCHEKTKRECIKCKNWFDSHMGKYDRCFRCHFT